MMMVHKKCTYCKGGFNPKDIRIKYCSDDCKKEGAKILAKKWKGRNAEYSRLWRRRYYQKNRALLIKKCKDYSKRTDYAYDKSPDRIKKAKIRWDTRALYKLGKIKKERCFKCGCKEDLHFHHYNYRSKFNYVILCKKCHIKIHDKYKEVQNQNARRNKPKASR